MPTIANAEVWAKVNRNHHQWMKFAPARKSASQLRVAELGSAGKVVTLSEQIRPLCGCPRMVEIIGFLAALLTAGSFVPQVVKIVRTRDTSGVSKRTYFISSAASALWVIYGVAISSLSIILCNATIGLLAIAIIALKWRWG